jgi:hypothetical protein
MTTQIHARTTTAPRPLICVSANAVEAAETRHLVHGTGERNVHSLLKMVDCIPVLMPPVGVAVDVEELVSRMSSHIIMEGRSFRPMSS